MPNWTNCEMTFEGQPDDIARLVADIEDCTGEGKMCSFLTPGFESKQSVGTAGGAVLSAHVDSSVFSMVVDGCWKGPHRWFKSVCAKWGFSGHYIDIDLSDDSVREIQVFEGELLGDSTSVYKEGESRVH